MKPNKTKLALVGIIVLTLIAPLPVALAKHGGHGGYEKSHGKGGLEGKFCSKAHFILGHAKELGLSSEQEDSLLNLKFDTKRSQISKDAEIDMLKLDIMRALHERTIQTEAINKLIDQKYELKKEKAKALVAAFANLKNQLTEEQYTKMKDLYRSKMDSHGKS